MTKECVYQMKSRQCGKSAELGEESRRKMKKRAAELMYKKHQGYANHREYNECHCFGSKRPKRKKRWLMWPATWHREDIYDMKNYFYDEDRRLYYEQVKN